jgi:hypothetical protein
MGTQAWSTTDLDAEIASVHIITQEQVTSFRRISTDLEKFHEIKVLAMNISADSDGRIHFQQIWFSLENFRPFVDNPEGLLLGQATFSAEMLLEEFQIGLRSVFGTPELVVRGRLHCGGLDIYQGSVW